MRREFLGVYPYSIVPGGLKSAQALRQAAASDKAVARHFSQFDYSRAHLVRLTEPREVYVSYRIRDTVFWTQKRIRLQAGEMLLTDGKITARAKCGNQVSSTAKPEVSNEEPEEDVLDQPVALEPMGPAVPIRQAGGCRSCLRVSRRRLNYMLAVFSSHTFLSVFHFLRGIVRF